MPVHGAMTGVHYHANGQAAVNAATKRARNTTIVIGADQKDGTLLLDIDVQSQVCRDKAELIDQLRLIIKALEGQEL
ncbi:hypothetical protein [Micrococcus sp. TA1]|uniref:hypothetical protein n=1 Tax=Micrococcus sp. TA1 TaxID=681627 RepID=UPI0016159305|nr:hypothetical protein [Micrococcus sp. TA1]MBB5748550.1 hypothetical protein [Micrococcus sp. TA1]